MVSYSAYIKYTVKNYGHSGSYIGDFGRSNASTLRYIKTAEYKQLKKDKPDAVIIMLGINDIGYITSDANLAEFKTAFAELIKGIKAIASKPVIYVCTPIVRVTAYSSYMALEVMREAEIAVANECGAYVIDTYNITKEYFGSYLYETDGLHPDDAGYRYLAKSIYEGVVNGLTAFSAGAANKTDDYVVYLDSSKGSYDSVGATPDKPTSSFARAVDLCKGGGTIVVSGPVTPATTGRNLIRVMIAPRNDYKIKVTSIDPYTGTDYRETNGAVMFMSGSMYLNGEYEFDRVNFNTVSSGVKLVCNYNTVTLGTGITCSYASGGHFLIIGGNDVVSVWQTNDMLSCKKDATLTIKSGTYSYLRGGNFRTYSASESAYPYGTIKNGITYTINISGGTFANEDSDTNFSAESRLTTAVGANGVDAGAAVNMNITGGVFKGSIFAVSRMNPYKAGSIPTIAGDINIKVSGGAILGSRFDYLQTYKDATNPAVTGNYSLNISGGSFASGAKKSISANGCANSTLTLSADRAYLTSWADVGGFKTINK